MVRRKRTAEAEERRRARIARTLEIRERRRQGETVEQATRIKPEQMPGKGGLSPAFERALRKPKK